MKEPVSLHSAILEWGDVCAARLIGVAQPRLRLGESGEEVGVEGGWVEPGQDGLHQAPSLKTARLLRAPKSASGHASIRFWS